MAPPVSRTDTDFGDGDYQAMIANVPDTPAFVSNGTATITFSFGANGNSSVVEYAIYNNGIGYLAADGSDNGVTAIWQTLAAWGNVTAIALTDFVAYTFKVKARNEDAVETVFSSDSAVMNTRPLVDYGQTSTNLDRDVTGGDTRVYGTPTVSGSTTTISDVEYLYGEVTLTYVLQNNEATASRIVVEFSEDNGSTWAAATEGATGDGTTALTTSVAGVTHTYSWDSYTDAGTSEEKTQVKLRITPYDASPSGGDAHASSSTDAFELSNRPATPTWEWSDTYEWDKDTTPTVQAIIPSLRGGTRGFPYAAFYRESDDVLVLEADCLDSVVGWEYEDAPDSWNALTVAGIPTANIDGINRMRYTVQAGDALAVAEYYLNGKMGEERDLS